MSYLVEVWISHPIQMPYDGLLLHLLTALPYTRPMAVYP